jgi:putative hydrolase of the HAD superfamily
MLDPARVHAITLDLDDTLWPIWPTIQRAEQALNAWLCTHAPRSAALFANPVARQTLRDHVLNTRPELAHDLSAVRREAIRLALYRANEDPLLAEPAFEVFFAERHKVDLYEDALPALEWLAQRYPLVSLSNGNADVERVGLAGLFTASLSAATFGVGKPSEDIFHAAAHAAGVLPSHVLHVGDDAHLDVLGALGAGMQAIWVNRQAQAWTHGLQPHGTVSQLTELCDLLA